MKKEVIIGVIIAIIFVVLGIIFFRKINNETNNIIQEPSGDTIVSGDNLDNNFYVPDNSGFAMNSEGDKLTFNFNNQYNVVFEFDNDKVSRYYREYNFASEEDAISFESNYTSEIGKGEITSIIREETKVSIVLNETNYKNSTREELEEMFSYLLES